MLFRTIIVGWRALSVLRHACRCVPRTQIMEDELNERDAFKKANKEACRVHELSKDSQEYRYLLHGEKSKLDLERAAPISRVLTDPLAAIGMFAQSASSISSSRERRTGAGEC